MNRAVPHAVVRPALAAASMADYAAMTKPRVVAMILLTTAAGFLMASPGPLLSIDWAGLAGVLAGTALVAGGTLALNQYMERDLDARMRRTRERPLPGGRMQPLEALLFGAALTSTGLLWLTFAVSPVSGLVTAATVISYLFCYTPLKTRTALCTVVGAFPGALPPITGWTAAGGEIGAGAAALFGILFFWQLPHSLAIAHLYREDYERAGIRLLPTVDRDGPSTGRQAMLNCVALLAAGMVPAAVGLAGPAYASVAVAAGLLMLWHGVRLALGPSPVRARRLLLASYVYIPAVMISMAADRVIG